MRDVADAQKRGSRVDMLRPEVQADEDDDLKTKMSAKRNSVLKRFAKFLWRRRKDIPAGCFFFACLIGGHLYMRRVLLQPSDSIFVSVFSPVYHLVYMLYISCWLSVIYLGPGKPPQGGRSSPLPNAIARALSAGRFCKPRSFDESDGWCNTCEACKPALVHHCSVCDQCGVWMDHHCMYCLTCIGFRNYRCFLLWLTYGACIGMMAGVCTARNLFLEPPTDKHAALRWVLWLAYMCSSLGSTLDYVNHCFMHIGLGWPSQVMATKFTELTKSITAVLERLEAIEFALGAQPLSAPEFATARETLTKLREARNAATWMDRKTKKSGPWGFLKYQDSSGRSSTTHAGRLTLFFGEPPSWRWLLPFQVGGIGDPLCPSIYDAGMCEKWGMVAEAMERAQALLEQHSSAQTREADRQAREQAEMEQRMSAMLNQSNQSSGHITGGAEVFV